ncbi:DUF5011 domain-containing protein [Clostridium sp. DSM 100503]|uniref:DUF5011 domain-containing protein n=1 Tax=Clostridium sp. DSM 100503 TaxID=2963282 RepID=UPI00214A7769|nr:DUF5011 domain-containing protein [Clostridium sp. DSM 100503]MCR1951298.1 DUF5011 domain-containing protein [Clostridium sp. DSM 100503]
MRITKNIIISILCLIIFSFNMTVSVFAENIVMDETIKSNSIVFVTEGQGGESAGDGSMNNPYRNIKTALKNVKPGGTIKIIGLLNFWKYEEHVTLLPKPLIINKEVTIEGIDSNSVFRTRAPIQLAANVTFKNIKMEFWASNELMPGVPDSGLPGAPVDTGTEFRSGRSIYLAGHSLTLDNVDTRINTVSFQKAYRPYISGGAFLGENSTGNNAVLNVINPNVGTELAGIYAGDYWVERDYPVELNIRGKVLDTTVYTGGITKPFNGNVVVNIYSKTGVAGIDKSNHTGIVDVNIKENTTVINGKFDGVRNLTLEDEADVSIGDSKDFTVEKLTINSKALLDLRKVTRNAIVNDDFIGYTGNADKDTSLLGAIFLHDNQTLDVGGDVKGVTKLNSKNNINKVRLKENHIYIKAKENATGNFIIEPDNSQSDYVLEKDSNNLQRTTWTTIRNKAIFKDLMWSGNIDNTIIDPGNTSEVTYPIEYINEKDEVYTPFGEDWIDFAATLEKPDGTILDSNNNNNNNNNNNWDMDLGVYLDETGAIIEIINTSFSGEVILTVTHKSGKSITKKIQIGQGQVANTLPTIHVKLRHEIYSGDSFDPLSIATATDNEDGDIALTDKNVVINKVNTKKAGEYTVKYEVIDKNGGRRTKTITVVVKERPITNKKPVITFPETTVIQTGSVFNPLDGVTAKDYKGQILSLTTSSIAWNKVNTNIGGEYQVKYIVTDSEGNSKIAYRTVKVEGQDIVTPPFTSKKPVITFETTELQVGDVFNPLDGVTAIDYKGQAIIMISAHIAWNKVDTSKVGTYQVKYRVEDAEGNYKIAYRDVIVK